ncbi:MAG: hypothetical protein ABIF10_02855 [Candidatus Woesearchaeota archaeon]
MRNQLDCAKNVGEVFSIVKSIVRECLGREQAGLLVAVSDLGAYDSHFVGALYNPSANTIVINKRGLSMPAHLLNYYLFHVIMHEYLHSLGFMDESQVKQMVSAITADYVGDVPSDLSEFTRFVPLGKPSGFDLDYVPGIDRENSGYIL